MDNRFEHIDINNEKVYKIVNSAFEVFSKNDLEKASTNMVVKQAGISRGLLYHYFKDKQELFDFLIYFSIKESITGLDEKINWEDSDFLNRLRQVVIIKLEYSQRYPYMMEFYDKYASKLTKSFLNKSVENISPRIKEIKDSSEWAELLLNVTRKQCDVIKLKASQLMFNEEQKIAIEKAIASAFSSCFDFRVMEYKKQNKINLENACIAVIVQKQIALDISGVGFSLNPNNNCYDEVMINAAGVIMEVGGPLQRGGIIAREYGIPYVSGMEI